MTPIEIFILGALCLLSLVSGYMFKDIFSGFGSNYFNSFIINIPSTWLLLEVEFISLFLKLIPLVFTFIVF